MNVGNITAKMLLDISDFAKNLRAASTQAKSTGASLSGLTVKADGTLQTLNQKTKEWGLNLKSVSRVVSGIIISQTFYKGVQSIHAANRATWEFTKQLEYAQIAYSNLFGDTKLATEFINVLEDFVATSPFTFTEAESAAKRLVAYGVESKNLMYAMNGIMAAASAQGDTSKIEQITLALGQIHTYGRLMATEVRQLTEAGIPVYEILNEKLGVTQKQLRNLGKEAIPASVALNALIDGMTERFGDSLKASSKTITGITSNIKDNALMIANDAIMPITVAIKSALYAFGEFLFRIREVIATKGIGGVFEELVPKELQGTLRQFAANFQIIHLAVIRLIASFGNLFGSVLKSGLMVFNALTPILTVTLNVLAALIKVISENATLIKILTALLAASAAAWVMFKVKALASAAVSTVLFGISKALAGLSTMLTFVVAHPFWGMLIGITAVLVGLSGGFGKVSSAINGMFKNLTKVSGIDPDKILLPSQKERISDLDKLNKKFDGTSDAMEDLASSTGKAVKAAKGLLSFDEVFKLNEPDEGTNKGIGNGWEDIKMPEIDFGKNDTFIPPIPDFREYLARLKNKFVEPIKKYLPIIVGAAIGAALGKALLGGILGGLTGLALGALVGFVWDKIADAFNLTPEERTRSLIVGGIGAGIGAILGGLAGGPLGAKIGAIVGGVVALWWSAFAEGIGVVPTQYAATFIGGLTHFLLMGVYQALGDFLKSLVPTYIDDAFVGFSRMASFSLKKSLLGGLKAGVKGAIISLGVGMLANSITAWMANEFGLAESDLENSAVGQSIGSLIGTAVGFIIGGPTGSIVGGAIGQLGGAIVGLFWDGITETLKGSILGTGGGALVGAIVGLLGGPIGAAGGALIGMLVGTIGGAISEVIKEIDGDWSLLGDAILLGLKDAFSWTTELFEMAGESFKKVKKAFEDQDWAAIGTYILEGIFNGFLAITSLIVEPLYKLFKAVYDGICGIFGIHSPATEMMPIGKNILLGVIEGFVGAVGNALTAIATVGGKLIGAIGGWFLDIGTNIANWTTNSATKIKDWATNSYNKVSTFATNSATKVKNWATNSINNIRSMASEGASKISTFASNAGGKISTWASNAKSKVTGAMSTFKNTISSGMSNALSSIGSFCSKALDKIGDWASNVGKKISGAIGGAKDYVVDWVGSKASAVGSYVKGLGGHATGGIFNREHVARFAEGNKAEAIIPLENGSAMQPFVDAVADGLTASLGPLLAGMQGNQQLQPLYVGTLIADESSLKELERKMEVIRMQENRR